MLGLLVTPGRPLWVDPSRSGHPDPSEGDPSTPTQPPSASGCLQMLSVIEAETEVMCCRFSPDGAMVAMGLANGTIKVHAVSGGTCVYVLRDAETLRHGVPATCVVFLQQSDTDRDLRLAATYASGRVLVWSVSMASARPLVREEQQTLCVTASPHSPTLTTGGSDGVVRGYDLVTRALTLTCSPSTSSQVMDGHRWRVHAVQCHPHCPHTIISGGWDNTVQFWDNRTSQAVRKLFGPHICGDSLQFDSTGNLTLTGSWRKHEALQIWDSGSGALIQDVPTADGERSSLYACRWLGEGAMVAAGSDPNMCRVVDAVSLMTTGAVTSLPGGVYCADVTSSSTSSRHVIIAIGSSSSLYLLTHAQRGDA